MAMAMLHEITEQDTFRLLDCLKALAEYHNYVSVHFQGMYPKRPYEATIALFSEALVRGTSRIAVVEENGTVIGFCKIDIEEMSDNDCRRGKLDYLVVLESCRGKGYGKTLMDWAMKQFHQLQVQQVEVKVIEGNETIHLYEKYGFKMNAHILWYVDQCTSEKI